MAKKDIKTASLDDLKAMQKHGDLFYDPNAPEGPDLGAEFWATAEVLNPPKKQSVHLRVDADVLEFFKRRGKGHLTRMNAVLRRYMEAQAPDHKNGPAR